MDEPRNPLWMTPAAARAAGAAPGRQAVLGREPAGGAPPEEDAPSRRSFLRLAGFGFAAATAAGCSRGAERKAIPYLVPPENIVPGRPYWTATTCAGCEAGCGMLAKGRDGRPVKLEGNPDHPLSGGGLCAVGQAEILALYDSRRLGGPRREGRAATWEEADAWVRRQLEQVRSKSGRAALLTGSLTSPSTRAIVERFLAENPGAVHAEYEVLSAAAIRSAHAVTHGAPVLPRYRFERAGCIVSFGADFLGTWISPVEFTAGWKTGRNPDARPPKMSRHWQFEARMSLTGSRADRRERLAPWDFGPALAALGRLLAERSGGQSLAGGGQATPGIEAAAEDLWRHRGQALVVCGVNDPGLQAVVNWINEMLGAYGGPLDLERPSQQLRGSDRELDALLSDLEQGRIDLLVTAGCNPAFDLPGRFAAAAGKAGMRIALASHADETTAGADLVLPTPHFLESWGDAEPVAGLLGLRQPAVRPLRDARSLRECLARWLGDEREDRELLRAFWKEAVYPQSGSPDGFEAFFTAALERGFVELPPPPPEALRFRPDAVRRLPAETPAPDTLALVLYAKAGMLDGRSAHNPWLHELPDPVTKVVWDNYACLAPATARELGLVQGDRVRLTDAERGLSLVLPAHVQPGQHPGVVAVALGYGRLGTDRFTGIGPEWLQGRRTVEAGGTVGENAAPFLTLRDGHLSLSGSAVRVEAAGGRFELACTQDHHSLTIPEHLAPPNGRVREAVLAADLADWGGDTGRALEHGQAEHSGDLWPDDHASEGPHWGLAVDLSACTGCSACVIACQAENNVPVVGRDEVRRHREMHWIRIDRYYQGGEDDPEVLHQPMMCQHCAHAPCETVCPVLATVHSRDGLNQQIYNRCVGTRYCANNCPYKVRRFNWFDYPREDRLQNMVLNPDVAVRSRGVMEKCSLCVQRILQERIEARSKGESVPDGAVQTACQQSCPAGAIVFGDRSDPESRVARQSAGARAYTVLEETNVQPAVRYLARISNRGGGEARHG